MSDKIRKTSLTEAKAEFEEIQNFAKEQAMKEIEGKVSKKIEELMNESIEKENVNEDVSIEMMKVKAGDKEIEIDGDGNVNVMGGDEDEMSDSEEIVVSADEDEVEVDETMDEMINDNMSEMEEYNMEEQEAQQQAAPAAPAEPTAEAPAEAPAMEEPAMEEPAEEGSETAEEKITDGLKELIQQMTGTVSGEEGEVEVIDDEAGEMPAEPAAPAAEAPAQPVQEDDMLEIVDEMNADEGVYEIVDEMNADEGVYEVVDEDDDEYETDEPMEEMHGVGHNMRHSNRLGKLPRQGVNHRSEINENENTESKLISEEAVVKQLKKVQAHYESKMDELIKENSRLKSKNEDLGETVESFKESFIELRNQFNEMQNFNAKLAYANKLFADGGFTVDEKKNIAEQFERVETAEEAQRLFKKIVKESRVSVSSKGFDKLKSPKTNTVQPTAQAEPLYESAYTRRLKELAGIEKPTED
jgi:hypothetical protein